LLFQILADLPITLANSYRAFFLTASCSSYVELPGSKNLRPRQHCWGFCSFSCHCCAVLPVIADHNLTFTGNSTLL